MSDPIFKVPTRTPAATKPVWDNILDDFKTIFKKNDSQDSEIKKLRGMIQGGASADFQAWKNGVLVIYTLPVIAMVAAPPDEE